MRVIGTAHDGKYVRTDDGTWRYAESREIVPGSEDVTITNFYNFRIIGEHIIVPRRLAWEQFDLAWCRQWATTPTDDGRVQHTPLEEGSDAIRVPIAEWDRMNRELGVIGIWAPELALKR